ncbi:hypothetical protein DFJ74DRAFT_694397 [Hyaloraphidium curvatum]|nr:hypothetical protein DFJ74DRAFT_694397 [Hyaloraphidium curvatum]
MGPRRSPRLALGAPNRSEHGAKPPAAVDEVALPPELLFLVLEVLGRCGWKRSLLEASLCCKALYSVGLPLLYRSIVIGRGGIAFEALGALFLDSEDDASEGIRMDAVRDLTVTGPAPQSLLESDYLHALTALLAKVGTATLRTPGMVELVAFINAAAASPSRIGADVLTESSWACGQFCAVFPPDPSPPQATVCFQVWEAEHRFVLAALEMASHNLAGVRLSHANVSRLEGILDGNLALRNAVVAATTTSRRLEAALALGLPLRGSRSRAGHRCPTFSRPSGARASGARGWRSWERIRCSIWKDPVSMLSSSSTPFPSWPPSGTGRGPEGSLQHSGLG